jgi:hypothetical protein
MKMETESAETLRKVVESVKNHVNEAADELQGIAAKGAKPGGHKAAAIVAMRGLITMALATLDHYVDVTEIASNRRELDELLGIVERAAVPPMVKQIVKDGLRAAAKQYHPDTGGSHQKMVEVNAAVDWLLRRR